MVASSWKRPSADDLTRRLSDEWYPGEWLEPVEPDIVGPYLERYMAAMSRRMVDYMRVKDADWRDRVSFLNLCLLIDQPHTFPIGARNLADGVYKPSRKTAKDVAKRLQFEFDRFVDFVAGLDPRIDRHGFVDMLRGAYGYQGDIDSVEFLGVLASRTAKRMADEHLRDWSRRSVGGRSVDGDDVAAAGTGGGTWDDMVRSHLAAWGVTADVDDDVMTDDTGGVTAHGGCAALDRAEKHWVQCVADARRNTPRVRRDVEAWCVWHAVLETVWRTDRRAYDARWRGVDVPKRDSRRFDELPASPVPVTNATADVATDLTGRALDGSAWNTLMSRMVVTHRRVSRGYARWCDMMPDENDLPMIRLASRAIADTPAFTDRMFASLCNALVRGDTEAPDDAREAMRMLLAYACVGRRVNLDGGGRTSSDSGDEPREYVYVGLRNAILGYEGYGGERRTLPPDEYRDYVALVSGESATTDGDDARTDDSRRRSVWMFPGMEDRFDSVRAAMTAQVNEAMAKGYDLSGMDVAPAKGVAMSESWWRFHDVADKAVNRWLGGETIHALAIDGHGHTLSYRSTNPVAAYQDVNAWRLAEALERYEGERGWGIGGRLADLYRDRGHLSKSGGRAVDRSIRDYADSARGAAEAVQYLASVTGLGMMLGADASVETFVRLIDLCDERGGERFRKSCWTLIRVAKSKRLRLTVPGAHGRRIGVRLMELTLADPDRLAEAEREFKIANLRRALGDDHRDDRIDGDGTSPVPGTFGEGAWRAVARDIDAAEHVVRGVMLAAFTRLRDMDRRWERIRVAPADCVGSHIDPASDGVCVFHGRSGNGAGTTVYGSLAVHDKATVYNGTVRRKGAQA